MFNKIFVKELEVETIIGIFSWEREVKQLVRISYEVEVDIDQVFKSDDIKDTFDYKKVSKKIVKLVESSSFGLIETMAEKISQIILKEKKTMSVLLSLSKPGALRGSKEVGIKIYRKKSA